MEKIRIAFLGAGPFAAPVLEALLKDPGLEVAEIVTQPDKPAGRKGILTATPLGQWCQAAGVAFRRADSVNDPVFLEHIRNEVRPDVIIVVSFGQILKDELLALPRLGCLNVHASLLPKYRGASPIVSAILNGESRTGVSFMRMDRGLDTGPVYRQLEMPLDDTVTAPELERRLAELAGRNLGDCLRRLAAGELTAVEQDQASATLSRKIRKRHAALDWSNDAAVLARKIRAFHPWPSTIFALQRGERLLTVKIAAGKAADPGPADSKPGEILSITKEGITVACGTGALRLEKVIPEGKKEMRAADFANGFRLERGMFFLNGPVISATGKEKRQHA